MEFYGKAAQAANGILKAFEEGRIPKALGKVFIDYKGDTPCRKWSWSNQLIVALAGHSDARGYRQWQEVGRHVNKGERSVSILVPIFKKRTETDSETGEEVESQRLVGFKTAAVFGYDQTDGAPLPGEQESTEFIDGLPLVSVAEHWGLSVQTFNGEKARYLGYYRHAQAIALGVKNQAT